MRAITQKLLLVAFVAMSALFLGGCATDDEIESRSARPWNAPKGWEGGIPTSLTEGR